MTLIRPNGLVERLYRSPHERPDPATYGRVQPGPATAEALRLAARQDRRKERRTRPDPLRGRLVDVEA
ncbi:MAG TPA: hypothetical protein VFG47_04590 [Geminicoccaceae bacterium]|nr:hypothetical protein [Geminicoccaceae bacterium]